jgi:UDP-N-acetylglucosamine 2-epimerase (non-hydrolysing)
MHRRESFGPRLQGIFESIRTIARSEVATHFVYPVHLNPNVAQPAERILAGLPNVHLIEPLAYEPFVYLMNRASLIVTDSGGIQEEAPSLGKRVIVVRERTERQEALSIGTISLGGTSPAALVPLMSDLLSKAPILSASSVNPYGNGRAAEAILTAIESHARKGKKK